MQKKTITILFLLIVLVSCASPAVPLTATTASRPTLTSTLTLTPTPTLTLTSSPTPSPTHREIVNFPVCSMEEFRKCPISTEDLLKGTNGDYYRWYKANHSKPFNPELIKNVPFTNFGGDIIFDISTAPNFEVVGSEQVHLTESAAMIEMPELGEFRWMVVPLEYYNPNDPDHPVVVMGLQPNYRSYQGIHYSYEADFAKIIKQWDTIKVPRIQMTSRFGYEPIEDPMMAKVREMYPDLDARFQRFLAGDVTALDGVLVLLDEGRWSDLDYLK